ncbi:uncharacterized protein LOC117169792 [Belonocnema kinseyi]|uniref:uncharacterized protein LOC117169792 n=1 Tax=Belonocnema kinseyi TaxID=2817044 RepID=UPI00143DC854|nr:uncharacterized protein LOC117169792 [Belonocnema kinseyi]
MVTQVHKKKKVSRADPQTDKRGEILTEWIAQHDFIISNVGEEPTFERLNYDSILDLTFATANIGRKIADWEVSKRETLSDHNYITFTIEDQPRCNRRTKTTKVWNPKKIDIEKTQKALKEVVINDTTTSAEEFSNKMRNVCDACMPKSKSVKWGQPMYLWNQEIAAIREICIHIRRKYTRAAKKGGWSIICDEVDRNVWGKGYQIVKKRLQGYPPKPQLTMTATEEVIRHLFPIHDLVHFEHAGPSEFPLFTKEELWSASRKMKCNKAPGPGNVPTEIIKQAAEFRPEYVISVYNRLAHGFREGRQTVDAIKEIVRIADEAAAYSKQCRHMCALITLDVKNAFNSASWQVILESLRKRGIEENLIDLVASYLSDRVLIFDAEDKIRARDVNSGVPQGLVLGPTLWNTQYDDLLRLELPKGVVLVGFADDIAMCIIHLRCVSFINRA